MRRSAGNNGILARRTIKRLLGKKRISKQDGLRLEKYMKQGLQGDGRAWEMFKRLMKRMLPVMQKLAKPALIGTLGPIKGALASVALDGVSNMILD